MKRTAFAIPAIYFILFLTLVLIQCSNDPTSPFDNAPVDISVAKKKLAKSSNRFGFKLFKEINTQSDPDKNIFISPLSISMALGMTYNGAVGSTEEAMRATLEFNDLTKLEINESYKNIIETLPQLDPKIQFDIANSIWYRQGLPIEVEFIDLSTRYFDALVKELDFGLPEAADIINGWVSDNTNGLIKEIVYNPINSNIVMLLLNAIYFKGAWTYEFDKDLTEDDWFTLPNGSKKPCAMMMHYTELDFFLGKDFDVVNLPYGDSIYHMTVFLPKPHIDIESIIMLLDEYTWAQWMSKLTSENIILQMPKFKLEYNLEMNDVLTALGMGVAFTQAADFTDLSRIIGLFISTVTHKTVVVVDEEGTEAAAVTRVDPNTSAPPYVRVDRSFFFVIWENHSQTILFIGKVTDPTPI